MSVSFVAEILSRTSLQARLFVLVLTGVVGFALAAGQPAQAMSLSATFTANDATTTNNITIESLQADIQVTKSDTPDPVTRVHR